MKINTSVQIENKADIIRELSKAYQTVDRFIRELNDERYIESKNGKWSPMQHLQHLILSSKRIPSVLNMSKIKLMLMGKSKRGSRTYDELLVVYKNALQTGVQAGTEYSPEADNSWTKEELLGNWKMIQHKFEKRIDKWSEEELDTYQMPHPALGKLTFREMLHFTIFHTYHHLKGMKE